VPVSIVAMETNQQLGLAACSSRFHSSRWWRQQRAQTGC
jgi:hypothetical protein